MLRIGFQARLSGCDRGLASRGGRFAGRRNHLGFAKLKHKRWAARSQRAAGVARRGTRSCVPERLFFQVGGRCRSDILSDDAGFWAKRKPLKGVERLRCEIPLGIWRRPVVGRAAGDSTPETLRSDNGGIVRRDSCLNNRVFRAGD